MRSRLLQTVSLLSIPARLLFFAVLLLQHGCNRDISHLSTPKIVKRELGKGRIFEVAYSPDGTRLAAATSLGVRIYDVDTYTEVTFLREDTLWGSRVAYSADGGLLAYGRSDGAIRLWDTQTWKHLHTLKGHTSPVWSIAFSPDGKKLASAGRDKLIQLWSLRDGKPLWSQVRHTHTVYCVAFSPDGNTLASGSAGGKIEFWDITTGEVRQEFKEHRNWIESIAFSPDGSIHSPVEARTG